MQHYPDLSGVLAGTAWAVVGGVATRLYMPERATLDLDVAVVREDGQRARTQLGNAGYRYEGELSVGGSSWVSPLGVLVDVLELATPWARDALAEAQANRDPQGLPVFTLPYLVLMKVQAGRLQDLADVSRMLGQASEAALQRVRRVFRRYDVEDMEDLESLIVLGRMEMGQPPQEG